MASGELDITQWDARIQHRHDEGGTEHMGMDQSKPYLLPDGSHPAVRRATIETLPVVTVQDRAFGAFPMAKSRVRAVFRVNANKWAQQCLARV